MKWVSKATAVAVCFFSLSAAATPPPDFNSEDAKKLAETSAIDFVLGRFMTPSQRKSIQDMLERRDSNRYISPYLAPQYLESMSTLRESRLLPPLGAPMDPPRIMETVESKPALLTPPKFSIEDLLKEEPKRGAYLYQVPRLMEYSERIDPAYSHLMFGQDAAHSATIEKLVAAMTANQALMEEAQVKLTEKQRNRLLNEKTDAELIRILRHPLSEWSKEQRQVVAKAYLQEIFGAERGFQKKLEEEPKSREWFRRLSREERRRALRLMGDPNAKEFQSWMKDLMGMDPETARAVYQIASPIVGPIVQLAATARHLTSQPPATKGSSGSSGSPFEYSKPSK